MKSRLASGCSRRVASPTRMSVVSFRFCCSARRRAAATMSALASSPATRPCAPTSLAISHNRKPGPQPMSRPRSPGRRASAARVRARCWTIAGEPYILSSRATPAPSNLLMRGRSKAVGRSGGEIPTGFALRERTVRRIALQAPRFDRADEHPFPRKVVARLEAGGDEQQAASGNAVVGAHRFGIGPRRLREHAGFHAVVLIDAERGAQIGLRALVAVQVLAPAG